MQGILCKLSHFICRASFAVKANCPHYMDGETGIVGDLVTL